MSPKNTLYEEDVQNIGKNLLKFTAPTLAVFFGQLAIGVDWRAALAVAILGLYGAAADVFKKYTSGSVQITTAQNLPEVAASAS